MGFRILRLILVTCFCPAAHGQVSNSSKEVFALAGPTNAQGYLELGFEYYEEKAFKEAVGPLQKAASLEPTNYQAHLYLGFTHYYYQAAAALTKAAQCATNESAAPYWLGKTLFCLKRFDEAARAYRTSLVLDSNQPLAWYGLGSCQFNLGSYQLAAKSYRQSALEDPTNYSANIWMGYSLIKADRFEQAAVAFQRATCLRPEDFDANLYRAVSLLRLLRFENAVPNLEQALKSKPDNRDVRELLLACYLVTGQMKKILPLHLGVFFAISILLVALYVPVTVLLFQRSMRPGPRPAPGLGFASAWWGVTMLGQTVLILAPMVLFSWSPSQALGVGIIHSGLPLIVAALARFARQSWGMPFAWPPRAPDRKGLLSIFAAILGTVVVSWGYSGLVEQIRGRPMPQQIIVQWLGSDVRSWPWSVYVGMAIAAPITEEIFFRGLLYGAVRKRLSTGWTIVLTSALFTLMHVEPIFFVPIFALGLALGWARHASQGLGLPVVIHCLNNCVALLVALRH